MIAKLETAAPTGRKKIAPGKERSDAALGHASQNTPSPEGAKEGGELPTGWRWMKASEVGVIHLGRQRSPKNRSAEFPTKYLRAANITENGIDLSDVLEMDFNPVERVRYQLQPGDILLSEASGSASHVGKPVVWKGELPLCCFQNTVIRLRPSAADSKYLLWLFTHFYRNGIFANVAGGVGINHLSASKFSQLSLPIAPPAEQRRIVAEIEKQFTRLEAGVAALRRVQANLKHYRAAVLKAACEGKLVPTEAELTAKSAKNTKNRSASLSASSAFSAVKNPGFETGEALLARILTERRQNWQGRGQYKEPAAPDETNLPPLPKGWTWASVEQLGDVQLGRQRSPKNVSKDYPTKYIRAANITERGIDVSDVLEMEFSPAERERFALRDGDVVLSEASGSPSQVGKPAVWRDELPLCCFQNTVLRLRPAVLGAKYVLAVFQHFYVNSVFAKVTGGVGINHLGAEKFSVIPFPLPPLAEQTRIVAEVERRLSVVEELESLVTANLQRATRLRQSILQKAFSGKL